MILVALALQAAPVVTQPAPAPPVDREAQIKAIALRALSGTMVFKNVVADDPALRKEFRRVGFQNGCTTLFATSREIINRHGAALEPLFVETVRRSIPDFAISNPPVRVLMMYGGKITHEVERSSDPLLGHAIADMKQSFVAATRALPPSRNRRDNQIKPEPALGQALGVKRYWNLDDPSQLLMACVDHRTPRAQRPEISSGANQR